jgi:hypothetical protein
MTLLVSTLILLLDEKSLLMPTFFLFFIFCYLRLVSPFLIILKELLRHENISHHLPRLCFPCCVMGGGGGVSHCKRPVGLTPDYLSVARKRIAD